MIQYGLPGGGSSARIQESRQPLKQHRYVLLCLGAHSLLAEQGLALQAVLERGFTGGGQRLDHGTAAFCPSAVHSDNCSISSWKPNGLNIVRVIAIKT